MLLTPLRVYSEEVTQASLLCSSITCESNVGAQSVISTTGLSYLCPELPGKEAWESSTRWSGSPDTRTLPPDWNSCSNNTLEMKTPRHRGRTVLNHRDSALGAVSLRPPVKHLSQEHRACLSSDFSESSRTSASEVFEKSQANGQESWPYPQLHGQGWQASPSPLCNRKGQGLQPMRSLCPHLSNCLSVPPRGLGMWKVLICE